MITDATATKASQNILRAFLITPNVLIVQLAKIVKISEKIRIFAAGYAKHIICPCPIKALYYGRHNTWN